MTCAGDFVVDGIESDRSHLDPNFIGFWFWLFPVSQVERFDRARLVEAKSFQLVSFLLYSQGREFIPASTIETITKLGNRFNHRLRIFQTFIVDFLAQTFDAGSDCLRRRIGVGVPESL